MDDCFGEFIDFLKETGRYDNSIVVLTSDHGDSLGEALRWGHSHTMFPEVVRVPLLVHLPPRLRQTFHADPGGVALSTDITPSLYALLGQIPADLGPLFGRPLFGPSDAQPPHRVGPLVAVSSYGAVYAVYRDNGSKLYIADAVNGRDYGYDLSGSAPVRVGVPPAERDADREEILARVSELARLYRFNPR
jgi:arylsulfatase A-like enzyme